MGTPQVVKKQSITWEAALQLFKHKKWPFVSVKEAADNDQTIAHRGDSEVMEALSTIGIEGLARGTLFHSGRPRKVDH